MNPHEVRAQTLVVDDLSIRIGQQLSEQVAQFDRVPRHESASLRAQHSKLSKDYTRVLNVFRSVKEKADRKNAEAVDVQATRPAPARVLRDQKTLEHDTQLRAQLQEEAINEAILREREEEIQEIHQNVVKVNEIFKDLAELVNDQQEDIDNVETMIARSNQHARRGLAEVEQANATNAGCCIS